MKDAEFSPNCDTVLSVDQDSVNARMLFLLKDNLFLALCVLYSAGFGFSLLDKDFSVIKTLMTIFLWLVFAQGKKEIVSVKYMRCVSGVIFAAYFVKLVFFILLVIFGLFCFVTVFFVYIWGGTSGFWDMFYYRIESYLSEHTSPSMSIPTMSVATSFLLLFLTIIAVVVIGILFVGFGQRSIHKFTQSLYKSVQCGKFNIVKINEAKTWLMVFGLWGIHIERETSSAAFLASSCTAAAVIVGSKLIGTYFKEVK